MNSKMSLFWSKAGETALFLLALLIPLAFYLRTYDSSAIKVLTFHTGVIALAMFWFLKSMERGRFELPTRAMGLLMPAAALLVWTVLTFMISDYKAAAFPGFLEQILYLVLFALVLVEFGGYMTTSRLFGWILTAAWIAGLYGLLQKLGLDPFIWKGAFGDRVFSTLGDPVAFAALLALCLPLALSRLLDPERSGSRKVLDLLLLALLSINTVWTRSPEGLTAFLVQGLVFGLVAPRFVPSKTAHRAAILSSGLVFCVFFGAIQLDPSAEAGLTQRISRTRQLWAGTSAMISEKPLTGHGPGSFAVHFPRFRPAALIRMEGGHDVHTKDPGNKLLELTAEIGLVGTGLWLWLFAGLLMAGWNAGKDFRAQGALGESACLAGVFSAVVGLLLTSFFAAGIGGFAQGWILWPLAGMLGGLSLLSRAGTSRVLVVGNKHWLYAPASVVTFSLMIFPALWFYSDIQQNIGVLRSQEGQWAKALMRFNNVVPGSPRYVTAQYFKGNVLLDQGKPKEALEQYALLESVSPDYVRLHYMKALAYAAAWDWDKAIESHERWAALDPLDADNYSHWAQAAIVTGDLEGARQAAFAAIALKPENPDHWQTLSLVYLKQKRTKAAKRLELQAKKLRTLKKADGG